MNTITLEEICRKMGRPAATIPAAARAAFSSFVTDYRPATPSEHQSHLLHLLKRIHDKKSARSAAENQAAFELGWTENLELCRSEGVSWNSLRPKYVRPFEIMRYDGAYVVPANPFLPDDLLSLHAILSFTTWLGEAPAVYEFGCGTGRYLFRLSELFPDKRLIGADWTEASFRILNLMAEGGRQIAGARFDMLNPDFTLRLEPRSAVVTVGALEQLGTQFDNFLGFILENKPSMVLHHEPVLEFYDDQNLFDYLAVLYHRKRGYLSGYWPALKDLERAGRVQILDNRRLFSGDPYHESSSFIAWRPL